MLRSVTPEVLVADPDADRALWLKQRRTGMGGSDAASALGLNPWMSPFALWFEKSGRFEGEVEETEPMLMGKLMEPIVLGRYVDAHPEVSLDTSPGLLRHPDIPFMVGTPDALRDDDGIVEAKAVGYDFAKEWEDDDVPVRYRMQTYHYGILTGRPFGVVAAIIGGQRYVERDIEFSQSSADRYVERLDQWWTEHIVKDVPPPIDASDSTTAALVALYDAEPDSVAVLSEEHAALAREYWAWHERVKEAESEKQLRANLLRDALGSAMFGVLDDDAPVASWKPQDNNRLDVKAFRADHPELARHYTKNTPSRVLRVSAKLKEEGTP